MTTAIVQLQCVTALIWSVQVGFSRIWSDRAGSAPTGSAVVPPAVVRAPSGVGLESHGRIMVGIQRLFPEVGFTFDHLASFCFSLRRAFSQHTAITPLDFLYLGSFRKKLFSQRDLFNSKRSFSCGKARFFGFKRAHHWGSFCTFAVAPT